MSKTRSPTAKLSDTQLVILAAAAQRADHSLLPFPESLTIKGTALNKVVDTLCKRKLAEERRTINGAAEWRRDEDGRPLGLFTTNAGLLALGVEDTETKAPSQAAASMPRQRKTAAARPRGKARTASPASAKRRAAPSQSKQDLVIQMLRRQSGVSIDDIIVQTGPQPHSVRGFFAGRCARAQASPLSPTSARTACVAVTSRPRILGVSHDTVVPPRPRPADAGAPRPNRARGGCDSWVVASDCPPDDWNSPGNGCTAAIHQGSVATC